MCMAEDQSDLSFLSDRCLCGTQADIYSFGVVLWVSPLSAS